MPGQRYHTQGKPANSHHVAKDTPTVVDLCHPTVGKINTVVTNGIIQTQHHNIHHQSEPRGFKPFSVTTHQNFDERVMGTLSVRRFCCVLQIKEQGHVLDVFGVICILRVYWFEI